MPKIIEELNGTKIELTVYQALTIRGALKNYDMSLLKYSIIKEIYDSIKDQILEKATMEEMEDFFPTSIVNVLLGKEPPYGNDK